MFWDKSVDAKDALCGGGGGALTSGRDKASSITERGFTNQTVRGLRFGIFLGIKDKRFWKNGFLCAVRSACANRGDALRMQYPWGWVRDPRWKIIITKKRSDLVLALIGFWAISQFSTSNRLQMLRRTLTLHRLLFLLLQSDRYSDNILWYESYTLISGSLFSQMVEINICALCSRSSLFNLSVFLSDYIQVCGGCL